MLSPEWWRILQIWTLKTLAMVGHGDISTQVSACQRLPSWELTELWELRLFNWHKATAILMTFDEDDFQKLVLNENGDIHETCQDGV